jgi:hypothetical protein
VGQDEQTGALYDFLYKDSGRVASYYAQIFGGRLASLERTDSDLERKSQTAGVNVHVAKGDVGTANEIQASTKSIIDPHDLVTTDVLSWIMQNGQVRDDVTDAPHGSLVKAYGTLVFVDKYMIEVALVGLEIAAEEKPEARTPEEKSRAKSFENLKKILAKIVLPSAFVVLTETGIQIAGTVKESGMEEPISTYYFKHGTIGGLSARHQGEALGILYPAAYPTPRSFAGRGSGP